MMEPPDANIIDYQTLDGGDARHNYVLKTTDNSTISSS